MQKKIIIIGATSGIGKEMAYLLAKQSHLVGITGRRAHLLEEIKAAFPDNIITSCFDVQEKDGRLYLEELINKLGGLDILIYNAGYGAVSKQLDYTIEMQTIRTNVTGYVAMVLFVFNYFMQNGKGQIALTSSIAALRGNSWAPAYSASKAFMSNYAEGLQIRAKKLKLPIYITDIKPGFIRTKMAQGHEQFWVAHPVKAARQILKAIEKKKRVAYIIRRWRLIAWLLPLIPFSLYRRIG
jgi:short-subunit dehydrogenase